MQCLTHTEFSFSTIHDGKAIPKLIAPGPSGFPYFSQLRRASSSVKAWYAGNTRYLPNQVRFLISTFF